MSVSEYTIPDLSTSEVIPRLSRKKDQESNQKKSQISTETENHNASISAEEIRRATIASGGDYSGFLKDELESDNEEDQEQQQHDSGMVFCKLIDVIVVIKRYF